MFLFVACLVPIYHDMCEWLEGGETLYGVAGPSGEATGGDQLNLAGILNTLDGVVDTPFGPEKRRAAVNPEKPPSRQSLSKPGLGGSWSGARRRKSSTLALALQPYRISFFFRAGHDVQPPREAGPCIDPAWSHRQNLSLDLHGR